MSVLRIVSLLPSDTPSHRVILELAAISILNCSIAVYFSQWDAVLWRSAAPNALLIIKLGPRNVKQLQFELGLIQVIAVSQIEVAFLNKLI